MGRLGLVLVCLLGTCPLVAGIEDTIDFGEVGETFGNSKKYSNAWKRGSGFFVTPEGLLLTDKGLVEDAETVIVVNANKAYEADVLPPKKKCSFALLKVRGGRFVPLAFSQMGTVHTGDRLSAAGYEVSDENGCTPSLVKCVVSELSRLKFKVFGNIPNSMAGSGILNADGQVVGMLIRFGGRCQTECEVLREGEIVGELPSSVTTRLLYTKGSPAEVTDLHRRLTESAAVVLVYNEGRRLEEAKVIETGNAPSWGVAEKKGPITFEKLPKLTESARSKRTHLAGSGSGFFLTTDGYLLTNHHVVDGAEELMVVFQGRAYPAELRAKNRESDLALLKLQGTFTPVSFAAEGTCIVGQTIFVVGYPKLQLQGLEPKVTKGVISSRSGFKGEESSYQMDAAIQPGNSGGPVSDESGHVVGVSVASLIGGQNVNYAIKLGEVERFLPKGVVVERRRFHRGKEFTDAVQEIVASTALVLKYAKGATPQSLDMVNPDRREEIESWVRKHVLYARLAKIKGRWQEVRELTESVLEVAPSEREAKELNDLARTELGQHLVIIAQADGRDVSAKIETICGFADKAVSCGKSLKLTDKDEKKGGFPVRARLTFRDDEGYTWVGDVDCVFDWIGTKEVIVKLKKEEML